MINHKKSFHNLLTTAYLDYNHKVMESEWKILFTENEWEIYWECHYVSVPNSENSMILRNFFSDENSYP